MNFNGWLKNLVCLLDETLVANGVNQVMAQYINLTVNILILILLILGINYVTKNFIVAAFKTFTDKTKTTFDDFLIKTKFPKYISQVIPLVLLYTLAPLILNDFRLALKVFGFFFNLYVIFLIVWIFRSLMRTLKNYLKTRDSFKDQPVESYVQVVMIVAWIIALLFIFAEITGENVIKFIISLGAASAILLLIFKDTILGFVASIQVSVNDIVRIGDWITFSKYGADGTVTEINLATVRVQNFDNTFTTIPTYSLISDSFQNWRGMQESPGRRIRRAIYIKQNSVKFVTSDDLENLKKISLITPYLQTRQEEIENYNASLAIDKSLPINGRNQTNLGVFRKYIDTYLHNHSAVHKELYVIVRHLAPTPQGIPLEVLCFSKDKRWENFEYISADIFDHIIAAVPYFGLKIFESPSGDDIYELLNTKFSS